MKNYLGLDWGVKEIGVALAHDETRLSVALAVLPFDAAFWPALSALIAEHEIGTIVVGVPHYVEQATTERAGRFAQEVAGRYPGLAVRLSSEMFTSKMAGARLAEAKKRGADDHAEAARIVLEDWLAHG